MMSLNRIDAILTDEQRDQAKAALSRLTEALPLLIDLSPKERAESVKFGEKNRSFVAKALAIAEAHPEMLPASFHLAQFRRDADLVEQLYPLLSGVEVLYGKLQDTYFAAGSDAYAAALAVYQYTKIHNETTGALEDSLSDLGRRFVHKGKKQPASTAAEIPA